MPHKTILNKDETIIPTFKEFLWIWNKHQNINTPPPQNKMGKWLTWCDNRNYKNKLLLAFRGSGKSSVAAIYCAWRLKLNPNLRILVISAEENLASLMVRNVKSLLEKHPLINAYFKGKNIRGSAVQLTVPRLQVLRDPSVKAQGVMANLTGGRAELVILDDVEVPNTVNTLIKRQNLRQRLTEIDYILTPNGEKLILGTPHSHDSVYLDYEALLDFFTFRLPVRDANGFSQWPDRFSDKVLSALEKKHGPYKFQSQMMLRPMSNKQVVLNPDLLCEYNEQPRYIEQNKNATLWIGDSKMISGCAYWDPATGLSKDKSALVILYIDTKGRYYVHKLAYLSLKQSSNQDIARQQCQEALNILNQHYMPIIYVETNGLGQFLPSLLKQEMQRSNINLAIVEVHNSKPKAQRIITAIDAPLAARQIMVHSSVYVGNLREEMIMFNPDNCTSGNSQDDGLDALAGAIAAEPIRLSFSYARGKRAAWKSNASYKAKLR